ncbi:MAG: single-stranded-DNA-specific exonuclease RecJ [Phycisphaeraceae bacterium]|nr:single-stranded-DNA-specific exonuclease RecJ [Phycisphaerales bacterium]QOJ16379.1 MAG: single-stranded-DNA-specific exonuclease RecJ [Phycisphaeraceae bacterium]
MRGLTHRWRWRREPPPSREGALVERVLAARGLSNPDEVRAFREPTLRALHAPGLMPNIDAAAERILDAAQRGRTIILYGDYDVDGVTGVAILYHTIKAIEPGARIGTFVPHRLEDGYGLNPDALRELHAGGAELVVSVDCGITGAEEARIARSIGLELIITDHHNVPTGDGALPEAICVHPRLPGSEYPFGDLCGAGVAFKLAWRLATRWAGSDKVGKQLQKVLLDLLPLAALGTIADVMPLVGENRVIASLGLRTIRATPFAGLKALIDAAGLADAKIDCEKVGFVLGPTLNAVGRLGHARDAMRLMTDAPPEEAIGLARRLAELNRQRQQTERTIVAQAADMAAHAGMTGTDRRAIVLAHDAWHPGVVGIVCSRLVDKHRRPVVLMNRQGGVCKGSARSIDGYSIAAGFAACADLLTKHGGHDMAAGLTMPDVNLDAFTERLTAHANEHIPIEWLTPSLEVDCEATLADLSAQAVMDLRSLSPFGRGNPRPVVFVRGAVLTTPPRTIGKDGGHLDLRLVQDVDGRRCFIRAVWWRAGSLAAQLQQNQRVDVAIEPKINEFNGRTSVEAEIRDIRIAAPTRATDRVRSIEAYNHG